MTSDKAWNTGDALLVVDVQRDFCPGGALAVEEGDRVVPVLNKWVREAQGRNAPTFFSRDWHPLGHPSFKERGGSWPPHCLQDTDGAAFHTDLDVPDGSVIVTKGVRFDKDQYSVFDETGLAEELKRRSIRRLWLGGLAQDVCVRYSALSAREAGFEVALIRNGTRPVSPEGAKEALDEMEKAGVQFV